MIIKNAMIPSSTQTDEFKDTTKKQKSVEMPSPRVMFQIPAIVAGFLGFILLFVALATPAWQVVYARELRQWVQNGLWMSCQTRPSGMYTCTYTFSKDDFDFYTSAEVVNIRTPAFYSWQRTLLHILLVGQVSALFAFISFCVSNSEAFEKTASIGYCILMAISTLIGLGCMLAFAAFSNMVEYRFYHVSVSGIYEKHHGYSYYVAIVGCIFYLISLGLSIAYVIRLLRKDGGWQEEENRRRRHETINAYRPPMVDEWTRSSQFSSSPYLSEEQFAMRALPDIPQKYRR